MDEIEALWQELESELSSEVGSRDTARVIINDIFERENLHTQLVAQLTASPEVTQAVLKRLIVGLDTEIVNGEIKLVPKPPATEN